jgi:hypothetical protein
MINLLLNKYGGQGIVTEWMVGSERVNKFFESADFESVLVFGEGIHT